jgi:hypothetical protein
MMFWSVSNAYGQPTISAEVARHRSEPGKVLYFGGMAEPSPLTLEQMTKASSLVLEAQLRTLRTERLKNDKGVRTDFTVIPTRIHHGVVAGNVATPGASVPIVLSVKQGRLVVDGLVIIGDVMGFEPLKDGVSYLLFLAPSVTKEPGHYQLYNYGAFELNSDTMRPLARDGRNVFRDWVADSYTMTAQKMATVATTKMIRLR